MQRHVTEEDIRRFFEYAARHFENDEPDDPILIHIDLWWNNESHGCRWELDRHGQLATRWRCSDRWKNHECQAPAEVAANAPLFMQINSFLDALQQDPQVQEISLVGTIGCNCSCDMEAHVPLTDLSAWDSVGYWDSKWYWPPRTS
jgi:hypothetical protein